MKFSDYIRGKSIAPSLAGKVIPVVDDTTGGVNKKGAEDFSGSGSLTIQTLAFNANITMNLVNGRWAKLTLTGNVTSFSFLGLAAGAQGKIIITQGGTGNYTINWGSAIVPPGGLQLYQDLGSITVVDYLYDGSRLILSSNQTPAAVVKRYTLTLASVDGSILIPAGTFVQSIVINPTSALTSSKAGTTNGGEELATAQPFPTGASTIVVNTYFASATSIYFTGITSNTTIFIYYA